MSIEKELAVLKGRVDGLEAKVGELEYQSRKYFQSGVLIIDSMDLSTGEIIKSAKAIQSTANLNSWRRVSSDNSAMFVSHNSSILFDNENNTGNWPLLKVSHFGDTSITGKDIVIGQSDFDGQYYYNSGMIPSPEGGWFVINKQGVADSGTL